MNVNSIWDVVRDRTKKKQKNMMLRIKTHVPLCQNTRPLSKALTHLCWNVKWPQNCCLVWRVLSHSHYSLACAVNMCMIFFFLHNYELDVFCVVLEGETDQLYFTSAGCYTMSRVQSSNYRWGWRCVCDISEIISYLYLYSSDDKHRQHKKHKT